MYFILYFKKSDITNNLEPDAELDQIKSTYRLQRNEKGEPAHIPFRYDVNIRLGGLYESDRNDQGYFEFDADTTILFTHNTDSKYLVLNAGNNPGYEVLSVDLSCKDEVQTQFLSLSLEKVKETGQIWYGTPQTPYIPDTKENFHLQPPID